MRKMERIIRAVAGSFVTISLILGYFVSPYWYLFTLFVGLNLFQSAFTKWCLAEEIFKKNRYRRTLFYGRKYEIRI